MGYVYDTQTSGLLIKVCEENGITAAAKKLHMTQPSVSQVIQELEAHYQTLLFKRLGRRILLQKPVVVYYVIHAML